MEGTNALRALSGVVLSAALGATVPLEASAAPGDVDATASIGPSSFYPVVDGYRDELVVEGTRDEAVQVDIEIRAASGGAIVEEGDVAQASGPYRWTWDGQAPNGASRPAALLPAGQYDVAVTLTDATANEKTVNRRISLSRNAVEWGPMTALRKRGVDFNRFGLDRNATLSARLSPYRGGLRLISRKGFAGVVYTFKIESKPGQVIDVVAFKLIGRSPNRHRAAIAVWNKELGGKESFANYDAGKLIGPGFKTWKTTDPLGEQHVKRGRIRGAVMTWKGLGRRGRSVFDIKKAIVTYRVGTVTEPAGRAAASESSAKSGRNDRPGSGRTVADIAGTRLLPPTEQSSD